MTGSVAVVARWVLAAGLAGLAVGLVDAAGLQAAVLLLPGLALGLGQRLAAPDRLPPIWTLFSGLAWVAGALLDAVAQIRPPGAGAWLIPTATMAVWQLFLLNRPGRAWPWLPVSMLAAFALQAAATGACAVACAPLAAAFGPGAATVATFAAGFLGYGLVTGVALPWLARPPRSARVPGVAGVREAAPPDDDLAGPVEPRAPR
jgi:hypothetical protein